MTRNPLVEATATESDTLLSPGDNAGFGVLMNDDDGGVEEFRDEEEPETTTHADETTTVSPTLSIFRYAWIFGRFPLLVLIVNVVVLLFPVVVHQGTIFIVPVDHLSMRLITCGTWMATAIWFYASAPRIEQQVQRYDQKQREQRQEQNVRSGSTFTTRSWKTWFIPDYDNVHGQVSRILDTMLTKPPPRQEHTAEAGGTTSTYPTGTSFLVNWSYGLAVLLLGFSCFLLAGTVMGTSTFVKERCDGIIDMRGRNPDTGYLEMQRGFNIMAMRSCVREEVIGMSTILGVIVWVAAGALLTSRAIPSGTAPIMFALASGVAFLYHSAPVLSTVLFFVTGMVAYSIMILRGGECMWKRSMFVCGMYAWIVGYVVWDAILYHPDLLYDISFGFDNICLLLLLIMGLILNHPVAKIFGLVFLGLAFANFVEIICYGLWGDIVADVLTDGLIGVAMIVGGHYIIIKPDTE